MYASMYACMYECMYAFEYSQHNSENTGKISQKSAVVTHILLQSIEQEADFWNSQKSLLLHLLHKNDYRAEFWDILLAQLAMGNRADHKILKSNFAAPFIHIK